MRHTWQLQEAKSKFSDVVNLAVSQGPQIVTKRGKDCAIILSIEQYEKLSKPKQSLKAFFQKAPKIDLDIQRAKDKERKLSL